MANFVNKITEMQYNSLSDFMVHYIEDVKEGVFASIVTKYEMVEKMLPDLLKESTPVDIDYGTPAITGYDREYLIGIVNYDNTDYELFITKAYDDKRNRYLDGYDVDDVVIIIGDIDDELMQKLKEDCHNIVIVSF